MKNVLLSTLEAASHGARLSSVETVANFPAPFSNAIAEHLKNIHDCDIINAETQSSALNICIGAELGGKRAFLPLSIPKCIDEFYTASFLRLPIVAVNVSRSIFSYSIKSDHNNILGLRDAGWLMFFPSNVQEIIDCTLQAYRICEDNKVLLPSVVNIEMPTLRETTQIPTEQFAKKFIPKFKLPHKIDIKNPKIIAPVDDYEKFVAQQQKAMSNAMQIFEKMNENYGKKLKRAFGLIEKYRMDDADFVIIMTGFHSTTAKIAVDKMRESGKNVGLLRLRVTRPWPENEIKDALENVKKIAVIDHDISLGNKGILYSELKTEKFINNYISFKYLREKNFFDIIEHLEKSEKEQRIWL